MRVAIILFILLGVQSVEAENTEHWTAWLYHSGTVLLINESGKELQRITLPVPQGQRVWEITASHNGQRIAYTSATESFDAAQLRVYDTQVRQLLLEYDLQYDPSTILNHVLQSSSIFNLDDTAFAFAPYNGEPDGWSIYVFDLESGALTRTLTRQTADTFVQRIAGNEPLLYNFVDDTVTFLLIWEGRVTPDTELLSSVDWNFTTDTFSENCAYTHIGHDTLEPSGLVVESAVHPDLGYVPDVDVDMTPYALEFYDPETHGRQVFYRSSEFLPRNPTFVQNGERIAFWGHPEDVKPGFERLMIIERDGSTVDQLDVLGRPTIKGVNDGFLYTTLYDVSGWVSKLTYVNTRGETPFTHQSVIWESQPDEFFRLVWAGSEHETPVADLMPWANYMTYSSNCPPYRG